MRMCASNKLVGKFHESSLSVHAKLVKTIVPFGFLHFSHRRHYLLLPFGASAPQARKRTRGQGDFFFISRLFFARKYVPRRGRSFDELAKKLFRINTPYTVPRTVCCPLALFASG